VSFLFPASTITFEAALRDVAAASWKARVNAARALGDVTAPAERRRAIAALVPALRDDRDEVRAEACCSLGALYAHDDDRAADPTDPTDRAGDVAPVVAALVSRLMDGAAIVRQNAAIALGSLGHADGFAPLAEALRDGPPDLRFQAATSLAEIDPPRAFEPLVAALADADPQVVGAAALSLGAIGDPRGVAPLVARVDHPDVAARFDVAYALADLGDGSGRAALAAGLVDSARAWDAVTALAKLGSVDDVEALARALVAKRTPIEASVLAAGRLLAIAPQSSHADAARRVVLAALTARKTHIRGLAVEQLGEAAGTWARLPLDKLARSGKGADLHEAIAAALARIDARARDGGAEAAP
jgi:HEAT repeat protein